MTVSAMAKDTLHLRRSLSERVSFSEEDETLPALLLFFFICFLHLKVKETIRGLSQLCLCLFLVSIDVTENPC